VVNWQISFLGLQQRPKGARCSPKKTLPIDHFFGKAAGFGTQIKKNRLWLGGLRLEYVV
jgi:hypothetical protein